MQSQEMKSFKIDSKTIQERLVSQNDLAFSFLSYMPIVPGHMLICPIRVVEACDEY